MYDRLNIQESLLKNRKIEFTRIYEGNLVNGTKNDCQNMVNGKKIGSHFWLLNENWPSKLVNGPKTFFLFG
jgi:hypothetical protein